MWMLGIQGYANQRLCFHYSNCHVLDFIAVFSVTVYKGELAECYSVDNYSLEILLWYPLHKEITPNPCYTSKICIGYSKSVLLRMYVYVVRTCIRCGTKMGGMKRHWFEKSGIDFYSTIYMSLYMTTQQWFLWSLCQILYTSL